MIFTFLDIISIVQVPHSDFSTYLSMLVYFISEYQEEKNKFLMNPI